MVPYTLFKAADDERADSLESIVASDESDAKIPESTGTTLDGNADV
jgi:hypothetical protein